MSTINDKADAHVPAVKALHVLNHTHWDREWYETFEQYRFKLRNGLRYVGELLTQGKLDVFFLDGQTIVLEDYKEIVSAREYEVLADHIRSGKIEVGPWYLLADEFLVAGESMIKNLELGTEMARSHGSRHNIGYLPDTFGHISQLPQILKGFQIDTALIFRGAVSDTFENRWEGADGTSVLTFVLPLFEGYYQTFLKHKQYVQETKRYLEGNAPYLTFGHALAMNGADHTFTSSDLSDRIEKLREELPGVEIKQTSMADFISIFRDKDITGRITGEQRDPSKIFILPGVYSTRSYLKDQNQRCEDAAIGIMEALNVWTNGSTDSGDFMTYVWKMILQNHPHDSICGCSIDEVHREMETRSQKALSAISQFAADALHSLYPFDYLDDTIENKYLHLIHNHPIPGKYPVRTVIVIPAGKDLGAIKLYDGERELPFDLLKRERGELFLRHILAEPHYGDFVSYEVAFTMSFEGVQTKSLRIQQVNETVAPLLVNCAESNSAESIANEHYSISWDSSGLMIKELATGLVHREQHVLISSLDAGDTYNYSPPVNDVTSEAVLMRVDNVIHGDTFQSCKLHYVMELPASLNEDRTGAHVDRVTNVMTTEVTLHQGSPLISFHTNVHNKAKDQKLRVGFAVAEGDISWSDTAFDLVRRTTLREKQWDMPKNKEAVMNQYPSYSTVIAGEHQLVHRGLQEYEVDDFKSSDTAFLTLIRGVGWLSRRDLRTRGNGAGPGFETPEAQCLGEYEFRYGLVIGKQRHSLNHKLRLRQEVLVQQSYTAGESRSLFSQSSSTIVYSSMMLKEEGTIHIRMFNPTDEHQESELRFGFKPTGLEEVDLTGATIKELVPRETATLAFGPKGIKTIRVRRETSPDQGCESSEGNETK
jgi:alpha-mannosidase/mannosylglycerate hydrolase